jgi:ribosome silencing factor RsfS/YbeB/iojap
MRSRAFLPLLSQRGLCSDRTGGRSDSEDPKTAITSEASADVQKPEDGNHDSSRAQIPTHVGVKFRPFKDEESQIILDYDEETYGVRRDNDGNEIVIDEDHESHNKYLYQEKKSPLNRALKLNLTRGETGVFDVEEVVELLNMEKMRDVAVIKIPAQLQYCDYMILASAISSRHLDAVTQYFKKMYKVKKDKNDPVLIIEGEKTSKDWKVMDMTKIIVHLMMEETRDKYDIETLWCVGHEFDDQTQRPVFDPVVDMMEKHIKFIDELHPQPVLDDNPTGFAVSPEAGAGAGTGGRTDPRPPPPSRVPR